MKKTIVVLLIILIGLSSCSLASAENESFQRMIPVFLSKADKTVEEWMETPESRALLILLSLFDISFNDKGNNYPKGDNVVTSIGRMDDESLLIAFFSDTESILIMYSPGAQYLSVMRTPQKGYHGASTSELTMSGLKAKGIISEYLMTWHNSSTSLDTLLTSLVKVFND